MAQPAFFACCSKLAIQTDILFQCSNVHATPKYGWQAFKYALEPEQVVVWLPSDRQFSTNESNKLKLDKLGRV